MDFEEELGREMAKPIEDALVLPGTGEVVDLRNEVACALAYKALGEHRDQVDAARRALVLALVDRSKVLGSKTFDLPGRYKASVSTGEKTVYDAEAIEAGLRELGMPEDRIREIVKEEVSHNVVAGEAKRAAGANEEYRELIEANKSTYQGTPSVSIRRG